MSYRRLGLNGFWDKSGPLPVPMSTPTEIGIQRIFFQNR